MTRKALLAHSRVAAVAEFQLTETPTLSRAASTVPRNCVSDPDALAAGWADAWLLRVDPRGQVQVVDGGLGVRRRHLEPGPNSTRTRCSSASSRAGTCGRSRVRGADRRTGAICGSLGHRLDDASAGMLTTAIAMLNWHDSAGFSAVDGAATDGRRCPGGHGSARAPGTRSSRAPTRRSSASSTTVETGCCWRGSTNWPERRFSILAGFVEAGESLEACVVREIARRGGARWSRRPLPGQPAVAVPPFGDDRVLRRRRPRPPIVFADGEIAEAHWFARDEVLAALEHGGLAVGHGRPAAVPGSMSIARGMLEAWAKA